MNIAVILSAGSGKRFDKNKPKQFAELNGKPIINHSIAVFNKFKDVDEVVVVARKDLIAKTKKLLPSKSKCKIVITGGLRRQDSVMNALLWIKSNKPNCKKVFIHDAARPFITDELLKKLYAASKSNVAVIPILKSDDTIKKVVDGFVVDTPSREELGRVQTPQVFDFKLLLDCYKKFPAKKLATDDAFIVEHFGHEVFCVQGERDNIKVTYNSDLPRAGSQLVSGIGYDSHKIIHGRKLVIGGVQLSKEFGPLGHSDGDALSHAIIDSVLGACGEKNIGMIFPDTDKKWKNASGIKLLQLTRDVVAKAGCKIRYIDSVLVMERPKLSPHTASIKKNIAKALGINELRVNIKAKTNEKMGFIGDGEGIAAFAIAIVEREFND